MVWKRIQAERQRGRDYQPRFQQRHVIGAWISVMQNGHHIGAGEEVLPKGSGLLSTLCMDQRPDDLALGDLNDQVEQLAHEFVRYSLA